MPVAKDETSRGEELQGLGWTPEEVRQYEELWEYRQRWGAINLEPEDRVLLRRAEAALPKRVAHGKSSLKKHCSRNLTTAGYVSIETPCSPPPKALASSPAKKPPG